LNILTIIKRHEVFVISASENVIAARQAVKKWAVEMGFSLSDQTKLITVTSELVHNIVIYAQNGTMLMEELDDKVRRGLRMTFHDDGPGIADIDRAMQGGYSTGSGLGLGLSGSKRLVDEFSLTSEVGKGTHIVVTRWK